MLAGVQLRLGHLERARELYEPFPRRGFADIPRGFSWLWTMEAAVQVCAALDDRAGASTLLELLSPYPDRWIELGPMAVCDGSVTRLLGLLETVLCRYAEAERHFEQALSVHSRIDARLLVARTQLDYAQMLLARGEPADRVRADELLDSAAHTAAELGLKRIASEAENLRRDVR